MKNIINYFRTIHKEEKLKRTIETQIPEKLKKKILKRTGLSVEVTQHLYILMVRSPQLSCRRYY